LVTHTISINYSTIRFTGLIFRIQRVASIFQHFLMRQFRQSFTAFALVSTTLILACESSDSSKNEVGADLDPDAERLVTLRSQIDLGLTQKSAWQFHWAESLGSFDAMSFELAFTDSIDPMEMPEKNPILPSDPLFPYQIQHPEGNGTMDIYSYKVEAQDGLERPFLNPDSEVIWYREDGMKERLLFMGPSGIFEDGFWLNSSEFMVLGYFQEEEGYRPMIWIIDVANHRFSQFKMTKVAKDYVPDSYLDTKLVFVDLS
jgi:hypothetical protein